MGKATAHDPPVLVDDRTGSRDLIHHPPFNKTAELCRLPSADVAFSGTINGRTATVGVEVKSVFDLIASVSNGRLQSKQIPAMLRAYDVSWLVVYGSWRPAKRGTTLQIRKKGRWVGYRIGRREVPYGYIEQALMTVEAAGIKVCRGLYDKREVACWVGALARWWAKGSHRLFEGFDESRRLVAPAGTDSRVEMRARVASCFPRMGYKRAMAAAERFGSVREMVGAGVEEWMEVEGVGKVVAKAIERVVS